MIDRKTLLEQGQLRKCADCSFETFERKEMRRHEFKFGHTQDTSMHLVPKKYTPEEIKKRDKNKKKWIKA